MRLSTFLALSGLLVAPAFAESPPQIDWLMRYSGTGNGNNQVTAMTLDAQGCTYVTGYSSGLLWDVATVKYSPSGRQLWAARFDGHHGGDDVPYGIALDGLGNLFVVGYSDGNGMGNYDFLTIKYDTTMVQQWVRIYTGQGNFGLDEAYAVTADASGNAYVTGFSFEAATGNDFVTIKYDSTGNPLWTRRFDGIASSDDGANAIALDSDGSVCVTGTTQRNPAGGNYDFTTLKYSSTGVLRWFDSFNGPANSNDEGIAIAVDSAHNIYAAGLQTGIGSLFDMATIKYSPTGRRIWLRTYDPNHSFDTAKALTLDADASVYVTGFATVSGTDSDYATLKYDSTGTNLWAMTYDGPVGGFDEAQSVAVDASGNVYVTGYSDGGTSIVNYDYATLKYDAAGAEQWLTRYDGTGDNIDIGVSVAIDPQSRVIVSGWSTGTHNNDVDFTTIAYAQIGAGTAPEAAAVSATQRLLEAFPNPFGLETNLRLFVPEEGCVELNLYDIAGRRIDAILKARLAAGTHVRQLSGAALEPGVYLYRLTAAGHTETGKLIRRR